MTDSYFDSDVGAAGILYIDLSYNLIGPSLVQQDVQVSDLLFKVLRCCHNEIVGVTSFSRKTIVTIAFINDFVQGGCVELFCFVSLYCYNMIG